MTKKEFTNILIKGKIDRAKKLLEEGYSVTVKIGTTPGSGVELFLGNCTEGKAAAQLAIAFFEKTEVINGEG